MKKRKTKGQPSPIDVHVGQRIRMRRSIMGLSQEKVANMLDLTFQQVQKYEKGTNRVSAGKLFEFSQILDVPVTYFYETEEGMIEATLGNSIVSLNGKTSNSEMRKREKERIELLRAYADMDTDARKSILTFMKNIKDKV